MNEWLIKNIYIDFHYKQMSGIIYGYVIVVSLYTNINIGRKNS